MALDPELVMAARSVAWLARVVESALAETAVSLPQYRLLSYLSTDTAAASHVADALAASRPSVTALVDGLVAKRLVSRREDATDRRRVAICLTPRGLRQLEQADAAVSERLQELSTLVSELEAKEAMHGLELWARIIGVARDLETAKAGA